MIVEDMTLEITYKGKTHTQNLVKSITFFVVFNITSALYFMEENTLISSLEALDIQESITLTDSDLNAVVVKKVG